MTEHDDEMVLVPRGLILELEKLADLVPAAKWEPEERRVEEFSVSSLCWWEHPDGTHMRWGIVVATFPQDGDNVSEIGVLMCADLGGNSPWFDCMMLSVDQVGGLFKDDAAGGWVTRFKASDGLQHMMPAAVVDRLCAATSLWSEPVR